MGAHLGRGVPLRKPRSVIVRLQNTRTECLDTDDCDGGGGGARCIYTEIYARTSVAIAVASFRDNIIAFMVVGWG